jgi:uncharacterized damage-inducible protein DinB
MSDVVVNLEVARLADQLERSFHGGAWHGPAVLEALDGVDEAVAAARPVIGAHSIWEITGHVGAWMQVAARRIRGAAKTPLSDEENFPPAGDATPDAWKTVQESLRHAYRELLEALRGLEDANLADTVPGSDPTVRGLVFGVIQHNAYHAGQLVLLRRAQEDSRDHT